MGNMYDYVVGFDAVFTPGSGILYTTFGSLNDFLNGELRMVLIIEDIVF